MAIGYACLTIGVPDTDLSRITLKYATEDNLRKVISKNLAALEVMIDYNIKNGIKLFRISSDIIPFGSHLVNELPWWEEFHTELYQLGQKIEKGRIRVSMHPGQYTVLNSPEKRVVENSVRDLEYHDRFLTSLGLSEKSKLVLHVGGVYGDKKRAMDTFVLNYSLLSETIKGRLVIENDDKNYNIKDVYTLSEKIGTPIIFDNLHHRINPPEEPDMVAKWLERCASTWMNKDGSPKIHYSQQKAGGTSGSHSDTINLVEFVNYYSEITISDLNIMLEVKDKNLSAMKCIHTITKDATAMELSEEWAKYETLVLSRSKEIYEEINELLKKPASRVSMDFYDLIDHALILPENKITEVKAARILWDRINEDSTPTEAKRYEKLMNAYIRGDGPIHPVKNHLLKCCKDRGLKDLLNSLYFYI